MRNSHSLTSRSDVALQPVGVCLVGLPAPIVCRCLRGWAKRGAVQIGGLEAHVDGRGGFPTMRLEATDHLGLEAILDWKR